MDSKDNLLLSTNDREKTAQTPTALEVRHSDGRIEHPQVKFEIKDVRLAAIMATVLGVAAVFIAVGAAAKTLFTAESRSKAQRFVPAAVREAGERLPAQPRLEPFQPQLPAADSYAADAQQLEDELQKRGRTSDDAFVRVPIEVAIQQMATKLQSKNDRGSRDSKRARAIVSGDANSGRVFREAGP